MKINRTHFLAAFQHMILQGLRIDVNVKLTNGKPLAMLN